MIKIKHSLIIVLHLVLFTLFSAAGVSAAATGSATTTNSTPSASPTNSQIEDIQEKIKNLVKENLTATESTLQERINQKSLAGYAGTIKSISSGNISIVLGDESLFQITTNSETSYFKNGTASKYSSLALGDKIIVIGNLLKSDILLGKKIIAVIPDNPEEVMTSSTAVAKILTIDTKKRTLELLIKDTKLIYTLTKKSAIDLSKLEENQTVFAIIKKYQGKNYLSNLKVID